MIKSSFIFSATIFFLTRTVSSNNTYYIHTQYEFLQFSKLVNKGITFSGTSVILESDMDCSNISAEFMPIGSDSNNPFMGTFDGQGYSIRNLQISTTNAYCTGLFGYSLGTTIRNVIIDRSCSIESIVEANSSVVMSSVIAMCQAYNESCTIRNIVSLGDITFNGNLYKQSLMMSGIIGTCVESSSLFRCMVRNCANHGTLMNIGSAYYGYFGGILSFCRGSQAHRCCILNCINSGSIHQAGSDFKALRIGGIAAYTSKKGWVDNCVSTNNIEVMPKTYEKLYMGGIVGSMKASSITNAYWSNKGQSLDAAGEVVDSYTIDCSEYDADTYMLNGDTEQNVYMLDILNSRADNYSSREYLHWARIWNGSTIQFKITNHDTSYQLKIREELIMMPCLASIGSKMFTGWYTDFNCTRIVTEYEYYTNTTLYAKWVNNTNNYIITFDTRGGKPIPPQSVKLGDKILLPRAERANYAIEWWEDEYEDEMPWDFVMLPRNITLRAVWACVRIQTADDLIDFAKVVKSGVDYKGTTVYLDADIDFATATKEISTIGVSSESCFLGTFDGQGYTISHLSVPTMVNYTALFALSMGMTLRNVILDSTCVVEKGSALAFNIGSFIGYCGAYEGPCIIENCVSMAQITLSLLTNYDSGSNIIYVGGLVGLMESMEYSSSVRNCAVYNDTIYYPIAGNYLITGGLVGACLGGINVLCYIQNNLYAGMIFQGVSYSNSFTYAGGIVGVDSYAEYKNCVNIGNITLGNNGKRSVGGIMGYLGFLSTMSHCYWKDSTDYYNAYGTEESSFLVRTSTCFNYYTLELCKPVSIGTYSTTNLLDALNRYAQKYYIYENFSSWLGNANMSSVNFTIQGRSRPYLSVKERLILTPKLAPSAKMLMRRWYTDAECKKPLEIFEVNEDTSLYAKWKNDTNVYTITFSTLSRRTKTPVESISAEYMSLVKLPQNLVAENVTGSCLFRGWYDEYKVLVSNEFVVPAKNITLYAAWLCNHITAANEFYELSRAVNSISGFVHSNTTIYLDADIDFADFNVKVPSIGKKDDYDDDYHFKGTFDGQGHTISNIMMDSIENDVGLFGYSFHGITVRNVVLDSSCTVGSLSSDSDINIGGIIGYCIGGKAPCAVKNSINMAAVEYKNSVNKDKTFMGGIVGSCSAYFNDCVVTNCANYGTISYVGNHIKCSVGGIFGQCYGYAAEAKCYTLNSVNYGSLMQVSITSEYVASGGIIGYAKRYNVIDNCVNVGTISFLGTASTIITGTIVGHIQKSYMRHCFSQASNEAVYSSYGSIDESSLDTVGFFRNYAFIINDTEMPLLEELNSRVDSKGYSKWALNKYSRTITFMINGFHYVTISSQVVLIPEIDHDSSTLFKGWFLNDARTKRFTDNEFYEDTTLWGYIVPVPVSFFNLKNILIIGGSSFFVFIVIVVLACIVGKKLHNKMLENEIIRSLVEPLLPDPLESSLNSMHNLYPENYRRPSLKVALINAGFKEETATSITRKCYIHAEELRDSNKLHEGVTVDDAAALALYTMDEKLINNNDEDDNEGDNYNKTPYRLINAALAAGTEDAIESVKDILYFIMVALRKLPIIHGKPLYRGIYNNPSYSENYSVVVSVKGGDTVKHYTEMKELAAPLVPQRSVKASNCVEINKSFSKAEYAEGDETVWRAISSTSPNISVTKTFLAQDAEAMKSVGILFIIEDGWGYDVQPYSMFPDEEEIVLEPERMFRVTSVIPGEGLTVVKLEMLRTPLALINVFGQKKLSLI